MSYVCKLVRIAADGQLLQIRYFGRLDAVPAGWSLITRMPVAAGGRR